jgi:hypothetical protein
MRFAVRLRLSTLAISCGIAAMAACGSQELDPIQEPASDAATQAPMPDVSAPSSGSGSGSPQADATSPVITDAGSKTEAGPTTDAGHPVCKRGIASNAAPGSALSPSASNPGVSWWYNWASQGSGQGAGIEFVPMIWGGSSSGPISSGSSYLLGFNEPNFKSQANLTPAQAAADWPKVEALAKSAGIPLVSPAVNYCGSSTDGSGCADPTVYDPYTYLKDFFNDCTGCEVDYIAVHWYNCDLPSLKAYLEGNLDAGGGLQGFTQFGKPIWLTEFSCNGSSTAAQNKAYMQAAVPYLEANPHIYRYSWFSAGPIPNAELMNSDGSLTDLGMTYVSLPQNCTP